MPKKTYCNHLCGNCYVIFAHKENCTKSKVFLATYDVNLVHSKIMMLKYLQKLLSGYKSHASLFFRKEFDIELSKGISCVFKYNIFYG